jgi:hypothetical protein
MKYNIVSKINQGIRGIHMQTHILVKSDNVNSMPHNSIHYLLWSITSIKKYYFSFNGCFWSIQNHSFAKTTLLDTNLNVNYQYPNYKRYSIDPSKNKR